ncbi:MAG: hypothetical protein H0W72_06070 [Planctomycetes bacterium]|nr:hypothetical protein [Planctomycetota bacterium]
MTVRRAGAMLLVLAVMLAAGCSPRASTSGASRMHSPSMSDPSPIGSASGETKEYLTYDP